MPELPKNAQPLPGETGAALPVSPHIGPAPRRPAGDVTTGVALMIAFSLLAPGIDIFAKLATQYVPSGEVAAARFLVQFVALLPIVLWRAGKSNAFRPANLLLHAMRGLLIGVATVCFITAISKMPIADAISIFFVEPMILTMLGGVLLGEKVGWRRYLAAIVGFIGAIIVVRPSFQELGWVALLPLGTALCFAFYLTLTRHMTARDDPFIMQGLAGLFGALFVGLALWVGHGTGSSVFDPIWPEPRGWLLLLGVGIFATISHLFIVFAFSRAPASVLAPLQYLEIVSATILSYLVFGDFPDALKWVGISIIVGSGLFIFWRERRVAMQESQN